jgi:hypothetical protein
MPGRQQDDLSQMHNVLGVRDQTRIQPFAKHLDEPVRGGFVRQAHHGARQVEPLGNFVEHLAMQAFPTQVPGDTSGDLRAARSRLARHSHVRLHRTG